MSAILCHIKKPPAEAVTSVRGGKVKCFICIQNVELRSKGERGAKHLPDAEVKAVPGCLMNFFVHFNLLFNFVLLIHNKWQLHSCITLGGYLGQILDFKTFLLIGFSLHALPKGFLSGNTHLSKQLKPNLKNISLLVANCFLSIS